MEIFYRAMTTYIDSKKPKEICYHARTIIKNGWKTCADCGLRLSRIFCYNLYSDLTGYIVKKQKEDRRPKIRKIMIEMMCAITRKGCMWEGEYCYYEPPEAGLPRELFDHTTELCRACLKHETNIKVICAVCAPRRCGIRLSPRILPP